MFGNAAGGYLLPDGAGGWQRTDPDFHARWSDERNKALNYQMKPTVRMLKAWNRAHSQRLSSFHLEVMVGEMFSSMNNNSRHRSQLFFQAASQWLHVGDPAGYGGDLAARLTAPQRLGVNRAFAAATERARRARAAESLGDHATAIKLWKIVYGDDFPAYG